MQVCSITSNVKGDKTPVVVKGVCSFETGRKKFGAILGDFTDIGCNSVLGRNTQVCPLSSVRGVVPENSIVKGERGVFTKE